MLKKKRPYSMRKVASASPIPCEAEEKNVIEKEENFKLKIANEIKIKADLDFLKENISFYDRRITALENENNKLKKEKELLDNVKIPKLREEHDLAQLEYNNCIIKILNPYCTWLVYKATNILGQEIILREYSDIIPQTITLHTNEITEIRDKIKKDNEEIQKLEIEYNNAMEDRKKASDELEKANKSLQECQQNPYFKLNLNLNSSCEEIKQKIKSINQKRINWSEKSLKLNYGINSLNTLNENKKIYDSLAKNAKKTLKKLENFNNPIPKEYEAEFKDFYNKVKNDLSFNKNKSKLFDSEIKNFKEKSKKTKAKTSNLKNKFLNLIEKLKTC